METREIARLSNMANRCVSCDRGKVQDWYTGNKYLYTIEYGRYHQNGPVIDTSRKGLWAGNEQIGDWG